MVDSHSYIRKYANEFHLSAVPLEPNGSEVPNWKARAARRIPGEGDLEFWRRCYPDCNVAIVTGRVSRIVALVIDGWAFGEEFKAMLAQNYHWRHLFPYTPTIETPHGYTLLFKHPGHEIDVLVYRRGAAKLYGDFQYVVAPPSVIGNNVPYQWMEGRSFEQTIPQPLPDWIINLFPGY